MDYTGAIRLRCGRPWLRGANRAPEDRGRDKSRPYKVSEVQGPKRTAARALALAASSSRFFGGALVSRERRRQPEMAAISSIAAWNEASLALDGLLKPLIFLTNCSEAARTSSGVTGGSKLKSVLIFRHMGSALSLGFADYVRCTKKQDKCWRCRTARRHHKIATTIAVGRPVRYIRIWKERMFTSIGPRRTSASGT